MKMPKVRPRSAFLVLLAALSPIAACSLLNPLEGYSGGTVAEAGIETATDARSETPDSAAAADASATCVGARPPARGDGTATGGSTTIVNALSTYEFSEVDDPARPFTKGLDLDRTCTCPGARSCKPANGSTAVCDFANGVDNAAGDYFLSLLSVLGKTATITAKIQAGDYGLLLRIRNYNDLPDDDDVEVAVFNSFGLDRSPPSGSDAGLPQNATPKFDGTDRWTVDAKSLLGGTAYLPTIVDTRAYVRGGMVVASVSNAIRIGPYTVPIVGGVLIAKLVKSGDSYAITEGTVSGRSNARELLTALESVPNPLDKTKYLCGDDAVYKNLRDRFCKGLDLVTDETLDGRDAPCDAASFSIRFTSSPASLGTVVDNGPPKKPCGDSWVATCP